VSDVVTEHDELKRRVEALLFAAEEPRTVRWMARFLGVDGKTLRKALDELVAEYAARPSSIFVREVMMNRGRILPPDFVAGMTSSWGEGTDAEDDGSPDTGLSAMEVEEEQGPDLLPPEQLPDELPPMRPLPAYQIAIRNEYRDLVQKLLPPELSRPVLGTLSMIATRQPMLQADLIRIRGKRAYAHMKELMAQRLVTRKAVQGTYAISTTSEFSRRYQIDTDAAKKIGADRKRPAKGKAAPEEDPAPAPAGVAEAPGSEPPVVLEAATAA
jgi:chromosome segregation and condensation protein ScpB